MNRFVSGLLGGAIGTVAMTVAMNRMHRRLPPEDRYPLPPRQVTMALADKAGAGLPDREDERTALTLVAHQAYGTIMGGLYAMIAPRTRWAPVLAGIPFGLAVWSGNYLGLLPAAGLHRPATEEPAPRNALMIAAHLIWAVTMAGVVNRFSDSGGHLQPNA